jgi:hypothetical protein
MAPPEASPVLITFSALFSAHPQPSSRKWHAPESGFLAIALASPETVSLFDCQKSMYLGNGVKIYDILGVICPA